MEPFERPGRCLNCLNPMPADANYCSHCGQKQAAPHDRSVWHLAVDAVGDFFHLDSKFFATLQPLLFRPGQLTAEYLSGRKARYFQPFKLFLFLSFAYFLTSGIIGHLQEKDEQGTAVVLPSAGAQSQAAVPAKHGNFNLSLDAAYDKGIDIPDDSLRMMVKKYGLNGFVSRTYPDASFVARYLVKKVILARLEGGFGENMGKTIPKLVFVLILFFAFLLKVIYRKKQVPYHDHVIFSLHFLSFFFLLFSAREILGLLSWWFRPFMVLLLLAYLFFALRKVYPLGYRATAWKFLLFFLGSMVTLLLFIFLATSIAFLMI